MNSSVIRRLLSLGVVVALGLLVALPGPAEAQGEGPRVYLLAPMGMNALTGIYLGLSSNMNFAQDILIKDADIESDVGVLSYVHFFPVGNRFAQLWVNGIWGSVGGSIKVGEDPPAIIPIPPGTNLDIPKVSGIADPYVAMRLGLIGAPALGLEELVQYKQGFQLHALLGATAPIGNYDSSRPLNLGTNRWSIRLGLPMVLPLGNPKTQTFWEVIPSVTVFTDNTDPFGAPDRREQAPLYILETHLSRNLTKKLWGSIDLRYQNGGETTTDGVPDDNRLGQLGAGATLAYQLTSSWMLLGSYGEIVAKNDDSRGEMLRLRITYSF